MFGKMKNMMDQMKMVERLMKDENFKAFMSNPKIQTLLQDPEFQEVLKTQDFNKMMNHPKFASLKGDQELVELIKKLNFPRD
jgi:hypothetical protein